MTDQPISTMDNTTYVVMGGTFPGSWGHAEELEEAIRICWQGYGRPAPIGRVFVFDPGSRFDHVDNMGGVYWEGDEPAQWNILEVDKAREAIFEASEERWRAGDTCGSCGDYDTTEVAAVDGKPYCRRCGAKGERVTRGEYAEVYLWPRDDEEDE